jgi:hypothetical protein
MSPGRSESGNRVDGQLGWLGVTNAGVTM